MAGLGEGHSRIGPLEPPLSDTRFWASHRLATVTDFFAQNLVVDQVAARPVGVMEFGPASSPLQTRRVLMGINTSGVQRLDARKRRNTEFHTQINKHITRVSKIMWRVQQEQNSVKQMLIHAKLCLIKCYCLSFYDHSVYHSFIYCRSVCLSHSWSVLKTVNYLIK